MQSVPFAFFRTTDWVTSKPLLGVAGLITVVMAMVSGFGLPMYLGLSWQPINMVAIFLTLGIGLDSVFLLLSSWTRSAAHSSDVVVRTSLTFSDAAVSLTIASLTTVLGFLVGAKFFDRFNLKASLMDMDALDTDTVDMDMVQYRVRHAKCTWSR